MNTQLPPIEPLDEQERELARIVHALPGGEPPAALDARILRAAANAAAASRRPGSRWLASTGALWGIGGAAAAVLALGVSWQMLVPMHPVSRSETLPAATMSDEAEDSSVSVEFQDQRQREFDNSGPPPPPPPAMAKSAPARRAPAPANVPASPLAEQMPEPFAADQLDEHVAASAESGASAEAVAAAPIVADSAKLEGFAAKSAAGGARDQAAAAQPQLSRNDAAQTRASAAEGKANAETVGTLASESEAPHMKPDVWLARIRQLRDKNRRARAKASLLEFHEQYPDLIIPADLAPLLRE